MKEKWIKNETVFDTFPQAFASTYDIPYADKYFKSISLTCLLKKSFLIFRGSIASLCNIKKNFDLHVEEIFNKVIVTPAWAEKINKQNNSSLDKFETYLSGFKNDNKSGAEKLSEFFSKQQEAHVTAWPMAIIDWDKSQFSTYLKENIKRIIKTPDPQLLFSELVISYPPRLKKSREALDKISSEPKVFRLLEIAREIIKLKRKRKNIFSLAFSEILPTIWDQLSQETNLSPDLIKWVYPYEIENLLTKKITADQLRERSKCHIFYSTASGNEVLTGNAASNFLKSIEFVDQSIPKEAKTIKGSVAHPGVASGTVKIINTKDELKKFKPGNILVSHMTDPSFVPIMKKAAAIVTDLGGITCHAAIVAREVKKPCIIGTGSATKSLRNGDKVEVDAGKGIVKKLI